MELPAPSETVQKPRISIADAIDSFIAFKAHRSVDARRKNRLVVDRMRRFMEARNKLSVPEITFNDLVAFRAQWTEALSTQRRNQENLKGFFRFCVKSEFIMKNPAADLDSIPESRPKTDPFTADEMQRIFAAIGKLPDEYGRLGQPIADQTKAFVLVMRYTGMAIGAVAKLEKADVQGNRIRTHRKRRAKMFSGSFHHSSLMPSATPRTTVNAISSGPEMGSCTRGPANGVRACNGCSCSPKSGSKRSNASVGQGES